MNEFLDTAKALPLSFWGILLGVFIILLFLIVFILRPKRDYRMEYEMGQLKDSVLRLNDANQQLSGGLNQLSETQVDTQSRLIRLLEDRLTTVQSHMNEALQATATKTSHSLGALMQRLESIDKAQTNIEKLSGDVLGLQDILANKQTRGAFGEIQLYDIVKSALPADVIKFQAVLSNGTRADCLVDLPNPPGPIVIDSKFPLEPYEALRNAKTDSEKKTAATYFRTAMRRHIRAISEKYIIEGETADGAIMFLPSEAVYAELHTSFVDMVQESFQARVWIVSPTTCMAVLTTMRSVLKDARLKEQAGAIRKELGFLGKDLGRLAERVGNLDRHFEQAQKDVEAIKISTEKATTRAHRLEDVEFSSDDEPVLPATNPTKITSK